MGRARDTGRIAYPPDRALAIWADLERWPRFVDGFERVVRADHSWPAVGSSLVWRSNPNGRGEVTEQVEASDAQRIVTRVTDLTLSGRQTFSAEPGPEGARLELELDYDLLQQGALTPITDALFIRRAVRDSLRRTLRALESEAAADPTII